MKSNGIIPKRRTARRTLLRHYLMLPFYIAVFPVFLVLYIVLAIIERDFSEINPIMYIKFVLKGPKIL